MEEAVILRIRELGNALEAREEIVERAVTCLDSEAAKLHLRHMVGGHGKLADELLYRAKTGGKNRVVRGDVV